MTGANGQLKVFVERIESIETEIKDRNEDKSEIYKEAKGSGFDVAALKAVIAKRRKDPDKLSEHEALVETYEAALGTPVATRVHARAEREPAAQPEERSPPIRPLSAVPRAAPEIDTTLPEFLDRTKQAVPAA